MEAHHHYDLIVIGSGPAGRRGAIQAAKLHTRVLVVERGRPIAELTPVQAEPSTLDERLALLEASGEITLPRGKKKGRARVQPASVHGRPVAETLLEDRD